MTSAATAPITTNDCPTYSPNRPISRSRSSFLPRSPGEAIPIPMLTTMLTTIAPPTVQSSAPT